jgi:hypothetical protein
MRRHFDPPSVSADSTARRAVMPAATLNALSHATELRTALPELGVAEPLAGDDRARGERVSEGRRAAKSRSHELP